MSERIRAVRSSRVQLIPSIRARHPGWLRLAAVLACVWLASAVWSAGWTRRTATSDTHIGVSRGCLAVAWISSRHDDPFDTWSFGRTSSAPRWLPYWIYHGSRSYWAVWVPLWLFAAIPGAASFVSFSRLFRWRSKGRCRECGYSLAGLAPNSPCPECGHARA